MSLAKLRLTPYYSKLAKFQASEEGGIRLEDVTDADARTVKQICHHLDLQVERKDGAILVTKPGHEFFDALDVAAPAAGDRGGLSEYVARGDLVGAAKLAERGTVSQTNLFTALLALPQGAEPEEGCRLLAAASRRAEWPSPEAQRFFEERARQATLLFLGEGKERLAEAKSKDTEALLRSSRCHLDVMLTEGRVKGEIMVGAGSRYEGGGRGAEADDPRQHGGRGLLAGDCAAIRPMDGGHMTECEVVVASPLILRPLTAPPPGTTGSGRPFRVDGLANRQQFSRTLTSVHLCAVPASKDGNCTKDRRKMCGLPGKHRPSEDVLDVLFGRVSKAVEVKGTEQVERSRLSGLNESQRKAMAEAASKSVTLVQGPPGTGKTTVAVRILKAWAGSKLRGGGVLCASDSNIAVDNVVEGLAREGVSVVRVGRPETARPEVLEHCAEELARKTLNLQGRKEGSYDAATRDRIRRAVQDAIGEAEVVCCTAIGAGSVVLHEHHFTRVLVDEAAQATELATLVPICRGASQAVLCGDQCQLPPTVALDGLRGEGLETSLFERLAAAAHRPQVLLEAQHRMHPAIAAFPRAAFYGGRLFDGVESAERPAPRGFAWPNASAPLCFLAVRGSERREGESLSNGAEAERALSVVQELLRAGLEPPQLGLVTPYAAQVRLLRSLLARAGLPTSREKGGVETNSVDGYQGREKEVIVISTVRSSSAGGLGFVADWRRANVAFTRARRGLVVIGDPSTLGREPTTWAPWLQWVRRSGCCSPRGCLDGLPEPRGEREAVGLAARPGAEPRELLEASAQAWGRGEGVPERRRRGRSRSQSHSDSGSPSTKRRKTEVKKDKKEKKKKGKKDKKKKDKSKKHKKKQKRQVSSGTESSSSS